MKRILPLCVLLVALGYLPVSAILDTNVNGFSDLWEMTYNDGNLFSTSLDPLDDPDFDGWTNEQEAVAGTNPLDPNPPDGFLRPEIVHIPATAGDPGTPEVVTVSWPTIPGKQYTLLYSPDLTEWLPVPDETFIGDGSDAEYVFFALTEADKLFWRVGVTDADSDTDGLTDAEEFLLGTDPTNAETLAGYPDLWLAEYFLEILINGDLPTIDPDADPDGDGLSNSVEAQIRTNPNHQDTDHDGSLDGEDPMPLDAAISWKMAADPNFAVIELPVTGPDSLAVDDISENGTVLFSRILSGSVTERVLVDSNQGVHTFPTMAQALDEFGSICPTLIGDRMLGVMLVPNAEFTELVAERRIWNPLDNSFAPFDWFYYEDSIIDARGQFWLNSWVNPVTNEIGAGLYTRQGKLSDSDYLYSQNARVERAGNVRSSGGYWRCQIAENSTISYGNFTAVPEDSGGFSATLTQTGTDSQGEEISNTWNLVPGGTHLHISKDTAPFIQSKLLLGPSRYPLAASSQGWVATTNEIWSNGTWLSLKNLLGGIPANQVSLLDMRDIGLSVANIQTAAGGAHKLALLVPVEMEIKHTEKERDDEGNETETVIHPGANTLLRDEIADLRIKVPTINNTNWDMKIDIELEDMRIATLGDRGVVQMYDIGKVENGTVTPLTTNSDGSRKMGPYDINLAASTGGEKTFKIVINKEGTFRLRLTSSDNKINVVSKQFTVAKRIRKYARRPENQNADFDRHDKAFEAAAKSWGTTFNHAIDADILKAIGMQESTLGYGSAAVDIMTINQGGNDQDHVLATLRKENGFNEREAIPNGNEGWTIRYLDYNDATASPARIAIHWGTCWLYHKAQKGRFVSDPDNPPHFVNFAGWNDWETAVGYYGPNSVYCGVIEGPWKRGRRDSTTGKVNGVWTKIDFPESDYQYLWPILSNQRHRK